MGTVSFDIDDMGEIVPSEIIESILQTAETLPTEEKARVAAIKKMAFGIRILIGESCSYSIPTVQEWIDRLKDVPQAMTAPDEYSWKNVGLIKDIRSITEERIERGLLETANIALEYSELVGLINPPRLSTSGTASQN